MWAEEECAPVARAGSELFDTRRCGLCPQDVKAGLEPHFVERYEQIFELAFQQQPPGKQQQQAETATAA